MFDKASSRRDFLKKTAYVAPLILTMNVSLAEAQVGSAQSPPSPGNDIRIHTYFGKHGKNGNKGVRRRLGWLFRSFRD